MLSLKAAMASQPSATPKQLPSSPDDSARKRAKSRFQSSRTPSSTSSLLASSPASVLLSSTAPPTAPRAAKIDDFVADPLPKSKASAPWTASQPIAAPKPIEDDKQDAIDWLLSINLSPPNTPARKPEKSKKTRFQSARSSSASTTPAASTHLNFSQPVLLSLSPPTTPRPLVRAMNADSILESSKPIKSPPTTPRGDRTAPQQPTPVSIEQATPSKTSPPLPRTTSHSSESLRVGPQVVLSITPPKSSFTTTASQHTTTTTLAADALEESGSKESFTAGDRRNDAENAASDNAIKAGGRAKGPVRYLFFPTANSTPISVFTLMPYVPRPDSKPKSNQSTNNNSSKGGGDDCLLDEDMPPTPLRRQNNNSEHRTSEPSTISTTPTTATTTMTTKSMKKSSYETSSSSSNAVPYDPELLDDPTLTEGKHRKLFDFGIMRVSFVHYVPQRERKEEMNEKFKARHPNIVKRQQLTLTRIRKLKRLMRQSFLNTNIATSDTLETIALSYVIFEKLILCEAVCAEDRRAYAAACVLISAKTTLDACLSKTFTRRFLIDLSRLFHVQIDRIIFFEAQICVRNDVGLLAPAAELNPHLERLRSLVATDTF